MNRQGWRNYQHRLNRRAAQKRFLMETGKYAIPVIALAGLIYGAVNGVFPLARHFLKPEPVIAEKNESHPETGLMDKKRVAAILDERKFVNLTEKEIKIPGQGEVYTVITTLDPQLQAFIHKQLDVKNSRYIGIVTLEPATGKILSMISLDKTNPGGNPCVDHQFPAASIFKIITAAAAIETLDFNENKQLSFTGGKYTLYQSQLKNQSSRFSRMITFQEAFAHSVNPVFGKIGYFELGRSGLEKYASGFGFNQPIDFEIPLAASEMRISEKPFNLAEIASGFNRTTKITPLHGALIAGAVANGGTLMEPFIVERIVNRDGHLLYRGETSRIKQAISDRTSKIVTHMMTAAVNSGTLRKSFRGYTRDDILSRLSIGGKTGSIDNDTHELRLDWFVGYANEKSGNRGIVISVLVAHEKFIGTRAAQYARMIMKEYFTNYFAHRQSASEKDAASFKGSRPKKV